MFLRFSKPSMVIFMLIRGAEMFACTNCISEDPLYLYPSEKWKVYTGFSKSDDFVFMDSNGSGVTQIGLDSRNTTTVALGHTFSSRAFVTVTAPYIVNERGNTQRSGWGDGMVTTRYMINKVDANNSWWPQIQGVVAIMDGRATSIYDYQDPAQLDVFGAGIPQWRVGLDAASGSPDWNGGIAANVSGPANSKETDFGTLRNGLTLEVKVEGSFAYGDRQKVSWGINFEKTSNKTLNQDTVANSASQGATAFIAGEAAIAHNSAIQLTLKKSAAIAFTRNFRRSDSVTGALVRSF